VKNPKTAALFREWVRLDKKRKGAGLSLSDLQRWGELKQQLNKTFSPDVSDDKLAMRESVTVPIRLRVNFESAGTLQGCLMTNLSRGGVFINSAMPPPIGTRIQLRLRLRDDGTEVEIPGEVVATNVGPAFELRQLGMAIRFLDAGPEASALLERLYEGALDLGGSKRKQSEA
jgi:uncharacterized protein (TIGR02266 family)